MAVGSKGLVGGNGGEEPAHRSHGDVWHTCNCIHGNHSKQQTAFV